MDDTYKSVEYQPAQFPWLAPPLLLHTANILVVMLKFIHSEKATKFCKISTLDLTVLHMVKFMVETSQNFVAFSEYMNFMAICCVFFIVLSHKMARMGYTQNSVEYQLPQFPRLALTLLPHTTNFLSLLSPKLHATARWLQMATHQKLK